MFVTRRALILDATSTVIIPTPGFTKNLYEGVPLGKAPGDYGYKHAEYHEAYQKVFGELLRCSCGAGDCRVTEYRPTLLGSPLGFDVIAYREWLPLPADTKIPPPEKVPAILRQEQAHICAYEVGYTLIVCAIINATGT